MLDFFELNALKVIMILYKGNKESFQKIRIGIENFEMDQSENQVCFEPVISLFNSENELNQIRFKAVFNIKDESLKNDLSDIDREESQTAISFLFTYIYPFIREIVSSILRETENPLVLPMINCRDINLANGLELTRRQQ